MNRPCTLPFENEADRRGYSGYYLQIVEITMSDGRNFFDHPIKNNITHMNIRVTSTLGYITLCIYYHGVTSTLG